MALKQAITGKLQLRWEQSEKDGTKEQDGCSGHSIRFLFFFSGRFKLSNTSWQRQLATLAGDRSDHLLVFLWVQIYMHMQVLP